MAPKPKTWRDIGNVQARQAGRRQQEAQDKAYRERNNPAVTAPTALTAPAAYAPGWTGDVGVAPSTSLPTPWAGDLGAAPRTADVSPGSVGSRKGSAPAPRVAEVPWWQRAGSIAKRVAGTAALDTAAVGGLMAQSIPGVGPLMNAAFNPKAAMAGTGQAALTAAQSIPGIGQIISAAVSNPDVLYKAAQTSPWLSQVIADLGLARNLGGRDMTTQTPPGSIRSSAFPTPTGWTGDLGYAPRTQQPGPFGWRGDLGLTPRIMDTRKSPFATGYGYGGGFSYGGGYGGGGRGGGGYGSGYGGNGYMPSWLLALNQWNYGE